ncbi:reverse transcriptase domain-containing protein [Tanacetum coccineum]
MSTRSSARRLLSPIEDPERLLSRRNRSEPSLLFDLEEDDMAGQAPPQGPIPDLRPMEELLQAPTDGVGDAIVVPPVLANQFELKIGLLNLVTSIAFHGFENDDPHSYIRRFTKITQTVKLNNVPSDVVKLLLFLFSLEGAAQTWLEKEPPNSITTWNDLVSKFVNRFFPPSKTTNLRNEITRFQQRFGETFAEAWDRFKDLLNKCLHHGFSPLHQIDTFYNSLNQSEQDSLNSAAGVASSSGSSAQDAHITSLTKQVEALLSLHRPVNSVQNRVNSVQNGCETCGGLHAYHECQAAGGYTQEDVYATTGTYNQGGNSYQPQGFRIIIKEIITIKTRDIFRTGFRQGQNSNVPHITYPSTDEMLRNFIISTEAKFNSLATPVSSMEKSLHERPQGVLPSNTVPNPREDLKAITTRSGVTLAGPSVPPPPLSSFAEVEREPETTTDQVLTESTTSLPPLIVQPSPASTSSELPPAPVTSLMIPEPNPHQPPIPYPSTLNKEKLQDKADIQIHSFLQMFKKIYFNISFAEALAHMPKFAKMVKDLLTNKEKLIEMANTSLNENCSAVLLKKLPEELRDTRRFLIPCDFYGFESCMALADLGASINLMPISAWKTLSLPERTPTQMTLELATQTAAYPAGIAEDVFV